MDALPLFLLVLSATVIGGIIGGIIAYSLCRLYYVWLATRAIAASWRALAKSSVVERRNAPEE